MTPPLVRELFALLPPPDQPFPQADRLRWLRAAAAVLQLLYPEGAGLGALQIEPSPGSYRCPWAEEIGS